jgi:hypothetical protein
MKLRESIILSISIMLKHLYCVVGLFHCCVYHFVDPVLFAAEPVALSALLPPLDGNADVLFAELDEFPSATCTGDTEDATNAVKTIAVTATTSTIPISDLMFDIRANKY